MRCLSLVLVALIFCSAALAQNTFTVKATAAGGVGGWALLGFYPAQLTVSVGDTVRFSVEGEAAAIAFAPSQPAIFSDSVSFVYNTILAPQTSPLAVSSNTATVCSGILATGTTFDFTMTAVGVYNVYDVLHPLTGSAYTVTVVNGPAPVAPAAIASQVDALLNIARAGVQSTISGNAALSATTPTSVANPDAGSTAKFYQVLLGFGTPALNASFNDVTPVNFTVAPGDSVQFVNNDIQSHMVAFDTTGAFSGCSNAYPTPAVSYYSANGNPAAFPATNFVSSGILLPNQIFTIRFATAGTYAYLDCEGGARGFVNVVIPPTTTPAATKRIKPIPAGRAIGQILVILLILLIISVIAIFLIVLIELDCREIFPCCK